MIGCFATNCMRFIRRRPIILKGFFFLFLLKGAFLGQPIHPLIDSWFGLWFTLSLEPSFLFSFLSFFFYYVSFVARCIRWMRGLRRESADSSSRKFIPSKLKRGERRRSDEPRPWRVSRTSPLFPVHGAVWYADTRIAALDYAAVFMQIDGNKFLTARPDDQRLRVYRRPG